MAVVPLLLTYEKMGEGLFLKTVCGSLVAFAAIYLTYKRCSPRIVTLDEVQDWAEHNCAKGQICNISRVSVMPLEIQKQVRREIGFAQVINGYKMDQSIFVVVTDSNGNIIKHHYILGKKLDQDLSNALTSSKIIRVEI